MKLHLLLLMLLSYSVTTRTFAQSNLTSDRPGQTNSAFSMGNQQLQIQGGTDYYRSRQTDSLTTKTAAVISNLTLRYGLPGQLEIRSSCNYNWNFIRDLSGKKNAQGPSDWLVGVRKTLFNRGDSSTSLALEANFFIPFKNEVYDRSTVRPQIAVLLYHPLGNLFSVASNVGFRFGEGTTIDPELFYTASLGYSITKKFSGFIEAYGTGWRGKLQNKIDAGLAYMIRPNFQLDLFAGFFGNDSIDENFVSLGFSWKPQKKKKQYTAPPNPSF